MNPRDRLIVALDVEGYDPAAISDPLYIRDDALREFVPLTSLADVKVR